MGLAKNAKHEQSAKNSKRGSVNNKRRLDAFVTGSGHSGASWGSCDPKRLQNIIDKITEMGGAVTLGLSRDKGAHSMTLLLDNDRQTLWFNGGADLDAELDQVWDKLELMSK